ncbi:hypothetical protein ASPZODRAFT_18691 [Penicilliopsis zonata CBS 506.65]|uniref:Uncharacterized protein n=1 Tax=Penicilliopsis zonata CBS 506.65 TaxID=1073090 RepID=A0A1L9SBG4_9EURO|nr:hypothetical protein ASPZODRAFT_18691 [Penicilliopsis zonata CBS 506.65]OJJ44501.1 hypothetical protein ASPZODRAFT_18691 [Penicilliopsis zonata CBS 506.65]
MKGEASNSNIQTLYDILGSIKVPPEDVFASGAHVSQITFGNSTDAVTLPVSVKLTRSTSSATTIRDLSGLADVSDVSLDRRTTTYMEEIITVECMDPPEGEYFLLSYIAQKRLYALICTYVEIESAGFWSVVGLTVSNLACGANLQYVCTGFFTLAAAETGYYISAGIRENCDATFKSIMDTCRKRGGVSTVEIIETKKKFLAVGVASGASEPVALYIEGTTDELCETYTCDGQCKKA